MTLASDRGRGPITQPLPFHGLVAAQPVKPAVRAKAKGAPPLGGMLLAISTAQKLSVGAWFGLAVAAPAALLALAAAATQVGAPRAAGFWAAMLLAPAIVLALRSVEVRNSELSAPELRDQDLRRALTLTIGQACGFLFVIVLGARFSGEAVAVGLAMAAAPLALAVARDVWLRIFPPLDERTYGQVEVSASRNWMQEWTDSQAPRRRPVPITPSPSAPIQLKTAGRIWLEVMPAEVDESWMSVGRLETLKTAAPAGPARARRAAPLH